LAGSTLSRLSFSGLPFTFRFDKFRVRIYDFYFKERIQLFVN